MKINIYLLILVILLSLIEASRFFLPVEMKEQGADLFNRYIVRKNFVIVDPAEVHQDKMIVQQVTLEHPGFITVRVISDISACEVSVVGSSRYLYAGEFFTITIPFVVANTTDRSLPAPVPSGKKLAIELYEDNGDGYLDLKTDKIVLSAFGSPIKTTIYVK